VITGFHHFSIACSDADRSLAFYGDLFGMRLVADREVEPGGFVEKVTRIPGARVRIVHLQGYGVNFELLEYREPQGDSRARGLNDAGSAHLCFVTDDLDETCERLKSSGVAVRSQGGAPVTIVGGPNDGGKGLYIEDPDGNAVEIIELARPWPSPGEQGGDSHVTVTGDE
jgi:catechol 2,3-dioxygenase-like lactoylglutathione lyase family enzyme